MAIFEKEGNPIQNRDYRGHLNRNWDAGNKGIESIHKEINMMVSNPNLPKPTIDEVQQARIGVNGEIHSRLKGRIDDIDIKSTIANEYLDRKADKEDVKNVIGEMENKRDSSVKIKRTDLDTSADSNKIGLNNLNEEVQNAMSGKAPVNPIIPDKSIVSEKYADNSVIFSKLASRKRLLNILPKDKNSWNPFRVAFEIGKPMLFNSKKQGSVDFFFVQEKNMGVCSEMIRIDDKNIHVEIGASTFIAVQEYDANKLGLKDSGWITKEGDYALLGATKYIILELKKRDGIQIDIRNERVFEDSYVFSENVNMQNSVLAKNIDAIVRAEDITNTVYSGIIDVEMKYDATSTRLCLQKISIDYATEYNVSFNSNEYEVSIMLIDKNNIGIQNTGWVSAPFKLKGTTNTVAIAVNIRFKDDSQINTSDFNNVNLSTKASNPALSNVIDSKIKNELNDSKRARFFNSDFFENGTLTNIDGKKNKVKKANQIGRVRSVSSIKLNANTAYAISSNISDDYRFSIQLCDLNDGHYYDSGWFEGAYYVTPSEDTNLWLVLKDNDHDNGLTIDIINDISFSIIEKERDQRALFEENYVFFGGHRGDSENAPENTLAAVFEAKKAGYDLTEFDVQVCLDRVPIIMHDDSVDRMTDGVGLVKDLNLSEIKALNINSGNGLDIYPNEKVPSFEEILMACKKNRIKPIVHFNIMNDLNDCVDVVNALKKTGMLEHVILIPPSNLALYRFNKIAPKLMACFLINDYGEDKINSHRILSMPNIAVAGWFKPGTIVKNNFIDEMHENNILCNGYIINDKDTSDRAVLSGIDIITTEKIEEIK